MPMANTKAISRPPRPPSIPPINMISPVSAANRTVVLSMLDMVVSQLLRFWNRTYCTHCAAHRPSGGALFVSFRVDYRGHRQSRLGGRECAQRFAPEDRRRTE